MKRIKLMTDYQCFPLWRMDGEVGDIDPITLPLSQETYHRLKQWAATYDAILDWNDPANSGFSTQQERESFEQEGIQLWQKLQQELAPHYKVFYKSYLLQKIVADPKELDLISTTTSWI